MYCCTPKALYNHGGSPQPPPVCSIHLDDATAATGQRHQCARHTPATGGEERESIEPIKWKRSPHTSYRWRGERDIDPIKCMRSPHTSYRWRGERDIEPIKCMRSPHTSYMWRGESHRANQVDLNVNVNMRQDKMRYWGQVNGDKIWDHMKWHNMTHNETLWLKTKWKPVVMRQYETRWIETIRQDC